MGVTPGRAEQRFPGYDVVAESGSWDPVTTRVVFDRLGDTEPLRFFTGEETPTAQALLDRLLAQEDEPKVPTLESIDRRLADGVGDGYRYSEMPDDPQAWRASLAGLNSDARAGHGRSFAELNQAEQLQLIDAVRCADRSWHGLPGPRVFSLWVRYACTAFYSHPWSWNEIGFGGPAYPRGYKNLGLDRREPWEVPEHEAIDPIPWIDRAKASKDRHSDAMWPKAANGGGGS